MAAPKGNRFWEARSSHGRNPKFESPEGLWKACSEYFEWVEEHPLHETKAFHFQGQITKTELPKMRAMTIAGLCLFLDISDETWANYRAKDDFIGIISRVETIIYTQKFTGAAADLLNANIISRELGLADKHEVKSTIIDMTEEELNQRIKELTDGHHDAGEKTPTSSVA